MGRARPRQTRTRSARSNGHTSGSRPRAPPRAAAPSTAGPRTAHPWPAASARVAPEVRATARGGRGRFRTLGRCSCARHSHAPACARPRAPPRARTRGLPTRGCQARARTPATRARPPSPWCARWLLVRGARAHTRARVRTRSYERPHAHARAEARTRALTRARTCARSLGRANAVAALTR